MRKVIFSGICWWLCLAGCAPAHQGTCEQIDDGRAFSARMIEGADPVFFHLPTAGDALHDPWSLRAVPAALEGAVIQAESAFRGTGGF
ncbi:MAG TPA: hypothetical protein PKX48_05825 [Planctomycetota bacterium]|jgi:hypothetical protein|nr:hypothetical protein [Planctomycetota bacterium]OQC19993.1 MAG: hypothetical protein BWX69_02269 [Planctomycetes bacterium ADurb.Bin069]HNR99539.1 hypothetical protein [Planctomycetota bacterium]HNU26552.1 hypothetical protein [Planctomycetota bacterium]HOE30698.1 hypothetical protein [Planctomycetota bacterium]